MESSQGGAFLIKAQFDTMSAKAEHDRIPSQKDKTYCNEDQECNQHSYLL